MSKLVYLKGLSTNLSRHSLKDGQILFTEDTGELYIDYLDSLSNTIIRQPIHDKELAQALQQYINSMNKVENKSSADIRSEITADDIENALGFLPVEELSSMPAEKVTYDNTESGLNGINVQAALDEVVEKNAVNQTGILTLEKELEDKASKTYVDTSISNLVDGAPETLNTLNEIANALANNQTVVEALDTAIGTKVDKVSGKGLSTNDYTTDEKNKLANIAAGAEVNVQSDWSATSGDAFIKNKPTFLTGGSQTSTSSADGGSNVYTFTKSDGTTSTLTVKNGSKGSTGDTGPKGDTGATPTIKVAAGSNINTVGTPTVTASTSGTTTTFTFNYLKGATGANATTTAVATTSANGLMSSSDKTKLNGIATGANKTSISFDSANSALLISF